MKEDPKQWQSKSGDDARYALKKHRHSRGEIIGLEEAGGGGGSVQDTGWRNIINTDNSGGAAQYSFLIRRTGNVVMGSFTGLKEITEEYSRIMGGASFPGDGFHFIPVANVYGQVFDWWGGALVPGAWQELQDNNWSVYGSITSDMQLRGSLMWMTLDEWPEVLPGTPYVPF